MSPLDGSTCGTKITIYLTLETSLQSAMLEQQIEDCTNAKQKEEKKFSSTLARLYALKLKVSVCYTTLLHYTTSKHLFVVCRMSVQKGASKLADITKHARMHFFFVCVEKKPKPSMTQRPEVDKVYAGESLSFKCNVELSSGWKYLWYKDGTELRIISNSLNIQNASSSDSGLYECMAIRNNRMYSTERSSGQNLRISGEPKTVTLC